jgi:hypothetical protein
MFRYVPILQMDTTTDDMTAAKAEFNWSHGLRGNGTPGSGQKKTAGKHTANLPRLTWNKEKGSGNGNGNGSGGGSGIVTHCKRYFNVNIST